VKEKLLRVLKLSLYPAFYMVCLLVFGYLTFPFDRLKDRLLSEITKQSSGKGAPTVTIDKLDSYWLSGAEVSGVRITLPADDKSASGLGGSKGFGAMGGFGGAAKAEPTTDSVIEVTEAHARARLLPLLLGRVQLDFWASVFGGEVEGTAPAGTSKGDVELLISEVKLGEIDPLQNLLGIPIDGKVNGELSLSPTDGKFSKASGKLAISIKGIVVSDGKTKIQGLLAIPPAKIDELAMVGEAEKGVLKITKLTANGPDLELDGDGKINVREPWGNSSIDLYIKFRFTDAYRGKDATTKSILGEPGSTAPPLIEMQVAKLKKAKRPDGFYGFHIHGKLNKPEFTPSPTETSGSGASRTKPGKSTDAAPLGGGKRIGGVALPLGMSSALVNHDKEKEKDKEKEAADKKDEEKKEDAPEERRMAIPIPAPPPPNPEPTPVPEPEAPVIVPPPNGPGDNPGGGPDKPEEKPLEEPR